MPRRRMTITAVSRWALGGVLFLAACNNEAPAPAAPQPVELSKAQRATVERLTGEWVLATDGDRDAAIAAVEAATESMNAMIRGVARSRITDSIHIDPTLSITEDKGIVTITRSELPKPFVAAADGKMFETLDDQGDAAKGQLRIEGDTVVSRVETDQGGGERTHRIDEAGNLVIRTRIFSPRLPGDIEYDSHYRRP